MLLVVFFALLTVAAAADSEPAAGRVSEKYGDDDDHLYLQAKLDGHHPSGPLIARTLDKSHGHPDIAKQDEIIRNTYSPDYIEPIWVLDYRYLKSGGRKYVRGPGGQILILPKNYVPKPEDDAKDYDSMIEHLRHKSMAEQRERSHKLNNHKKHEEPDY